MKEVFTIIIPFQKYFTGNFESNTNQNTRKNINKEKSLVKLIKVKNKYERIIILGVIVNNIWEWIQGNNYHDL